MAIYTTFFLCRPEELPGGFPRLEAAAGEAGPPQVPQPVYW
jgi:hypothetical protein